MKNVSESSPWPSLITTSSSEPLRFCIRRSLARRHLGDDRDRLAERQRRDRGELAALRVPARVVREQVADGPHAERPLERGRRLAADGAVEARLEGEGGHAPSLGRSGRRRRCVGRYPQIPVAMSDEERAAVPIRCGQIDPDAVSRDDHLLGVGCAALQLAEVRAEVVRHAALVAETRQGGHGRGDVGRGGGADQQKHAGGVPDDPVAAEHEGRVRGSGPDEAHTVALESQVADGRLSDVGRGERVAICGQVRRRDRVVGRRSRDSAWVTVSQSTSSARRRRRARRGGSAAAAGEGRSEDRGEDDRGQCAPAAADHAVSDSLEVPCPEHRVIVVTRIIAGRAGSIALEVPDAGTRPTSDRVRESLFGALESADALQGAAVLDLYAGSGALGLEAVSRGAASADLVEKSPRAAAIVERNAAKVAKSVGRDAAIRVHRIAGVGIPGRPRAGRTTSCSSIRRTTSTSPS